MHIPPHQLRQYAELVSAALAVHRDLADTHARAARDHGRLAVVLDDIISLLRTGGLPPAGNLASDLRLVASEGLEELVERDLEAIGESDDEG